MVVRMFQRCHRRRSSRLGTPSIAAPDHVLRSDRFDAVVEAGFDEANRIAWSGFEIAKKMILLR